MQDLKKGVQPCCRVCKKDFTSFYSWIDHIQNECSVNTKYQNLTGGPTLSLVPISILSPEKQLNNTENQKDSTGKKYEDATVLQEKTVCSFQKTHLKPIRPARNNIAIQQQVYFSTAQAPTFGDSPPGHGEQVQNVIPVSDSIPFSVTNIGCQQVLSSSSHPQAPVSEKPLSFLPVESSKSLDSPLITQVITVQSQVVNHPLVSASAHETASDGVPVRPIYPKELNKKQDSETNKSSINASNDSNIDNFSHSRSEVSNTVSASETVLNSVQSSEDRFSCVGHNHSSITGPQREMNFQGVTVNCCDISVENPENRICFKSWEDWWTKWQRHKSRSAIEYLRVKSDFYRCMSFHCDYSTMKAKDFFEHIRTSHPEESCICSYCFQESFNGESLVRHSQQHQTLNFQCPHCVYRASRPHHVRWHWKQFHSEVQVTKVWRLPWPVKSNGLPELKEDHIQPYICTECQFQTKNLKEFSFHQIHHPSTCCSYCGYVPSSFDTLLHHLKMHNICNFHSYFCTFAADNVLDVFEHLSLNHPDKPFKLCSRADIQVLDDENEVKDQEGVSKVDAPVLLSVNSEKELANLSQNAAVPEITTVLDVQQKGTCAVLSKGNVLRERAPLHTTSDEQDAISNILGNATRSPSKTNKNVKFNFVCVFCNFVTTRSEEMANHLRNEIPESGNSMIEKWIAKYIKAQKSSKGLVPKMTQNTRSDQQLCPMCSRKCMHKSQLTDHLCRHIQYTPFKCSKCDKSFCSQYLVATHAREYHSEVIIPFTYCSIYHVDKWINKLVYGEDSSSWPMQCCGTCNWKCKSVQAILEHFEENHPNTPLAFRTQSPGRKKTKKRNVSQKTKCSEPTTQVSLFELQESTPKSVSSEGSHIMEEICTVNATQEFSINDPKSTQKADLPEIICITDEVCPVNVTNVSLPQDGGSPYEADHIIEEEVCSVNITTEKSTVFSKSMVPDNSDTNSESLKSNDCDSEPAVLKCSICKFSTLDLNEFKDHYKSKHNTRTLKRKSPLHSKSTKKPTKGGCTNATSDASHTSASSKELLVKCKYCRRPYTKSSLNAHIKKRHLLRNQKPAKPISNDEEDGNSEDTVKDLNTPNEPASTTNHKYSKHSISERNIEELEKVFSSDSDLSGPTVNNNSDSDYSVPLRKYAKSTASYKNKKRRRTIITSSSDSDSCRSGPEKRKRLVVEVESEQTNASSIEETEYSSSYGRKPKPVDFLNTFIVHTNPDNGSIIRVALEYYKDIWFLKTLKVRAEDCMLTALNPQYPQP